VLPGICLFGFCIATGSVTARATAGADYGMALLRTVLLSCAITAYLVDLYRRFTRVTGKTALSAFLRRIRLSSSGAHGARVRQGYRGDGHPR